MPVKLLLLFAAAILPSVASAQTASSLTVGTYSFPPNAAYNLYSETSRLQRVDDTPSMRQQRFEKALALRAEDDEMLLANGGELTSANKAYVRRRSREILNGR